MDLFASVKFKKLRDDAIIPTRGTPVAAGLDLHAVEALSLAPGAFAAVSTGVAIELSPDYEAQVRPRSGLAAKYGITVLNSPGTIDEDYRGEVKVILINHGPSVFDIKVGDRVGQLVTAKVDRIRVEEVAVLSESGRGTNGFGSTGR
jgi:dUTP pyrophosphatase